MLIWQAMPYPKLVGESVDGTAYPWPHRLAGAVLDAKPLNEVDRCGVMEFHTLCHYGFGIIAVAQRSIKKARKTANARGKGAVVAE